MGNMPKSEAIPRGGPKGNVAERAGSSGVFVFYNYTNSPVFGISLRLQK